METASAVQARVEVKPSYGLGDEDIARMLQDSLGTAEADLRARALREQQVDAQRLIEATDAALSADADLLSAAERAEVEARLAAVRGVAAGDEADAIKAAVDALAHATDEFAARRMDRSIRAALAGRRVDEVMAR